VPADGQDAVDVRIEIDDEVWVEEVERLRPEALARLQAERARQEIESDSSGLPWKPCLGEGPEGTNLAHCVKLYVPVRREGASAAPYGLVFRLSRVDAGLVLRMVAFGERHPTNRRTRSVYERAHYRLHGRYP